MVEEEKEQAVPGRGGRSRKKAGVHFKPKNCFSLENSLCSSPEKERDQRVLPPRAAIPPLVPGSAAGHPLPALQVLQLPQVRRTVSLIVDCSATKVIN